MDLFNQMKRWEFSTYMQVRFVRPLAEANHAIATSRLKLESVSTLVDPYLALLDKSVDTTT